MKRLAAAAALLLSASIGAPAAFAQKLEADALARSPSVTSVSMSTEGDLLVGIVADPRDRDRKALATWDISKVDGAKPLQPGYITPSGKMSFVVTAALKAGKVVAVANQPWTGRICGGEGRSVGATQTWAYELFVGDHDIRTLTDPFIPGKQLGISQDLQKCLELNASPGIRDLPLDPDNIIIQRLDPGSLSARYSKLNLRTGKYEDLYRDNSELRIDLLDPRDGKVRTKQKIDPSPRGFDILTYVLNPTTGQFDLKPQLTVDAKSRISMDVVGFDESSGKYYVITDKFSDKAAAYLYDARTDAFDAEPLFAHQEFNTTGVVLGVHKGDFNKLLGFRYEGATTRTYWLDPDLKSIQDGLEAAYRGQQVYLIDMTDDRSKVLFATDAGDHPSNYYLLLGKSKVVAIGGERPWIKPETLGKGSLVYYEARDGMRIPAFLTLPPGFKKGDTPPPAIVMPHGGPWARDDLGWDRSGWPQYFATRGYAVLQPQYRGSAGWGRSLWLAGDGEWGQKMQDDKDDGAAWMIAQGYAAKGRLAIFGYSYGGFAAFAAAVRPNGPFNCAIAGAGVSNLEKIHNNWGENRFQRAMQGRTVEGMDPLKNASKLAMPILMFHGDRDVRVPLEHSTAFYNAVKATGKARLIVMKDQGHQFDKWTPENIRTSLAAIDSFLKDECKLQ